VVKNGQAGDGTSHIFVVVSVDFSGNFQGLLVSRLDLRNVSLTFIVIRQVMQARVIEGVRVSISFLCEIGQLEINGARFGEVTHFLIEIADLLQRADCLAMLWT